MTFFALPPWMIPTFVVVKGGEKASSRSAAIVSISRSSRPAARMAEAPVSG